MFDLYGSHFEYDGRFSKRYNLIFAAVNTDRMAKTSGDIESVTVFNKSLSKRYLVGTNNANSPLSFDVEIITDNDRCLNRQECHDIKKWLFNRNSYKKLYLSLEDDHYGNTYEYIDGERKRYYINCRFINPEKIEYNGGICGYKVTIEADSGMLWQDGVIKEFELNNSKDSTSYINIDIDTDFDDYVYPKITIEIGSEGGDITIINATDDDTRLTKFIDIPVHNTLIVQGGINYVNQFYDKFSKSNFVRLLDGENQFIITGNVKSIKFEYSARRML